MRIAHVSDCYLPRTGGIERQVSELACRQAAQGHEVHVFAAVEGREAHHGAKVTVHRPHGPNLLRTRIRYDWAVKGAADVVLGQFDVVHSHVSTVSPLAVSAAAAAARAGQPAAVTVHSLWTNLRPLYRPIDRMFGISALPLAWSAVSEIAAESVRPIVGPAHSVTILPNGVDSDEWRTEDVPRRDDRVVFATVGRLAARKRPRHLIRMLRDVRTQVPDHVRLEAVLVGDGSQRRLLEVLLRRYGMADWVRLAGIRTHAEVRELFESVDVYVAPATLESFGIAALEARCAGLPVVARARSGIAGFITHGVDGLLARDDQEMTEQLVRIVTDSDLRTGLRNHNRAHRPPTGWDEVLQACEQLYARAESLVSPRSAGTAVAP